MYTTTAFHLFCLLLKVAGGIPVATGPRIHLTLTDKINKRCIMLLFNRISLLILLLILTGCTLQPTNFWQQATLNAVNRYAPAAQARLQPYFQRAQINYPPAAIALLIFKKERKLELWAWQDNKWHYIKTYSVLAESGMLGPKLHEGDHQVPEGIYQITAFNPLSHYHLSLHLNYPDAVDIEHAKMDGRTNLGGNIFIHGDAKSIGCIAIGNHAIEELFILVYRVGKNHAQVIIAPTDLRATTPTIHLQGEPPWLPQLYQHLTWALQVFKQ